MSSRRRSAAAIIARSIAVATKPHGGKMLALIRPALPVRFGWRRIRCRQVRTKWAAKARPPLPLSALIRETPSVIGRSKAEITLQPIRRFGFDAAILFSDILVVPHALGQRVTFVEGEGPRLDALNDPAALLTLRAEIAHEALEPVYDTIVRVRQDLPPAVAFLGFCGAPWTLATYMIAGQGTPAAQTRPE